MSPKCPFSVGEMVIFNPDGKQLLTHPSQKNSQECLIESIDSDWYDYGTGNVWKINFKVVSTGQIFKGYSSEYFGKQEIFEF